MRVRSVESVGARARERKAERANTRSHSFDVGFDSHLFVQQKSFVGNAYITMNISQIHARSQICVYANSRRVCVDGWVGALAPHLRTLTFRNFIGKHTFA